MIDDFSYVKSAWDFATTHRLVYNGWATAMIGWQIAWGGLFAAIFGHTYSAVRAANFVTSFLTVWVMHAAILRSGVSRRNAVAGTLAVALCPLFLPMSISFMTDISGLFSVVVCFYCCLRALQSGTDRRVLVWLIAAGLLSTVGATARQIAWMSPLVMVPCAAWLLRRRRGVVPAAVVLWLVAASAMLASVRWFAHQPLSVPEGLVQGAINAKSLRELLGNMTAALLCLLLILLPLLAAWTRVRLSAVKVALVVVAAAVLFFLFRVVTSHGMEKGIAPWTGDVLDKIGMMGYRNAWSLGVEPVPFSLPLRVALSVLVLGVTVWFALAVRRTVPVATRTALPWRDLLVLTVPFLLAYFTLLAPRAMWGIVIDRYLLLPVFFAVMFLLRLYAERVSEHLPVRSLVLLAAFALFAVLGTHDWVALHRARVSATARLQGTGVSRTAIEAGYELDGMVQIQATGAVADPRVSYPAGMDMAPWRPEGLTAGCREIFNDHTPVIRAVYFLSASPSEPSLRPGEAPCLVPSGVASQTYTAWMPPFHRQIFILRRP